MRIVELRETTVPIRSALRNAFIGFSEMTASAVALITDVIRDGKPVVGFGFNSNGRYAVGGLLRERFFPRLLAGIGAFTLVGFALSFGDARRAYGVFAAVHAWIEIPLLLLAVTPLTAAPRTSPA